MREFFKTYKSSFILLGCTILGAIIGLVLGPKATVLKPFGDLFINLIMMIVVPLVFFSVSSSVAKSTQADRVGKIFGSRGFFVFKQCRRRSYNWRLYSHWIGRHHHRPGNNWQPCTFGATRYRERTKS